jgi:hypothetical protein
MNKTANSFLKVYPWYAGLTGDLLFYIAVDTLFLTIVKNFSPAEIGLAFSAILLSYPMLVVISVMLGISLIEIILSIVLYRSISIEKSRHEIENHVEAVR